MIEINDNNLETIFQAADWDRKFRVFPDGNISHLWRDATEATQGLAALEEETERVCRGLFLASDSLGEFLAVTTEDWEA